MLTTINIHADSTNQRSTAPGGYAAIISGTGWIISHSKSQRRVDTRKPTTNEWTSWP